jgi:sterol desaturase/sphingolipid hydroxylase (fatty acid hydroxylase superfamily)
MGTIVAGIQWILDFICPSASLYGVDAIRVLEFTIPVAAIVPIVFLGAILERIRPIENHDTPEARATIHTEWMLVAFMATIGIVLQILWLIVFGRTAAAIGGPLLYLEPQSVLGSVALVVVYALYIDCAKYWMHRLSHRIPLLWAVHSFHHSAECLTVATGVRHHWAERIILIPFWFLTVTLFQVPEHLMAMAVLLMKVPDGLQHLNYKIAWHRAGLWVNTPQWHRIHHSVEPEHFDKNFSSAFPIMDVIFGTAYRPAPDEYPETGLSTRTCGRESYGRFRDGWGLVSEVAVLDFPGRDRRGQYLIAANFEIMFLVVTTDPTLIDSCQFEECASPTLP